MLFSIGTPTYHAVVTTEFQDDIIIIFQIRDNTILPQYLQDQGQCCFVSHESHCPFVAQIGQSAWLSTHKSKEGILSFSIFKNEAPFFTARKRSCGKVMFLHQSVILFMGGASCSGGASESGGVHPWTPPEHTGPWTHTPGHTPPGHTPRSTSGRHATYLNAFLCKVCIATDVAMTYFRLNELAKEHKITQIYLHCNKNSYPKIIVLSFQFPISHIYLTVHRRELPLVVQYRSLLSS